MPTDEKLNVHMTRNRHQRRPDLRAFRRSHAVLLTYMVAADDPCDGHPLLVRAAAFWRDGIERRKPVCIGCKAAFADGAEVVPVCDASDCTHIGQRFSTVRPVLA